MILKNQALSMAESMEYVKGSETEDSKEIIGFMKKFTKLKPEQAKELREKIQKLDLMKVKEEHISKIIDLMPENQEDLNKIFEDVSLDDEESKKILEIIK